MEKQADVTNSWGQDPAPEELLCCGHFLNFPES